MRVLILYDPAYTNTSRIAEAIAAGFDNRSSVVVKEVDSVNLKMLWEIETLIVGSLNQGSRPTKRITDFLMSIPPKGLQSIAVAAFDTRHKSNSLRSSLYRMFISKDAYASKYIDRILVKKGGIQVLPPEGFYVRRGRGPILQKELYRAKEWGREIEVLIP